MRGQTDYWDGRSEISRKRHCGASLSFLLLGAHDWVPYLANGIVVILVDIYYRANIDPSDRYVLSVSGSTSSRLTGYKSGFSNLYP
ncbi:MAG: hypothetical protein WBV90_19550, partial [Terrimicrobiaceae bacterium]